MSKSDFVGEDCKSIMMDFVKLLRDDAEEVLDALVPNIEATLECLCHAGLLSRESVAPGTLEISRALLKCQSDIFRYHNWRRKMTFLQQLECLPHVLESDFIHQHFTSVVLKLIISAVRSLALQLVNKSTKSSYCTDELLLSQHCVIRFQQIFKGKFFGRGRSRSARRPPGPSWCSFATT